jgi:hypothetical protein
MSLLDRLYKMLPLHRHRGGHQYQCIRLEHELLASRKCSKLCLQERSTDAKDRYHSKILLSWKFHKH